jgi:hypothetical protein
VVQHAVRVDEVEAVGGEGQVLGVGDPQLGLGEALGGDASAGLGEAVRAEVDADGLGAAAQPLHEVGAGADADLQHAQAGGSGEAGEAGDVLVDGVALGLGLALASARIGLVQAPGAAGLAVPVVADLGLQGLVVAGRHGETRAYALSPALPRFALPSRRCAGSPG